MKKIIENLAIWFREARKDFQELFTAKMIIFVFLLYTFLTLGCDFLLLLIMYGM